jgi:hypothetical protein
MTSNKQKKAAKENIKKSPARSSGNNSKERVGPALEIAPLGCAPLQ